MTKALKNKTIKKALILQDKGNKEDAVNLLKEFLKDEPEDKSIIGLIGAILVDDNKFKRATPYLQKSIYLKSQSELIHLSLYIAYVKLNQFNKSIEVLCNYLDHNPAKLFRDTLEELLIDLSNGYATTYKSKIIYYAKKNNIDIPNEIKEQ